jgi:hypothetical protein
VASVRRRRGGVWTYVRRPSGCGISGVTDGHVGGWHFFRPGSRGVDARRSKGPASHELTMFGEKAIVACLITRSDLPAAIG